MPKYPQRFWLAALVAAWAFDFLFWDKPLGISFFVWVVLALAAGYLLAVSEEVRPARRTVLLSALLLTCAGLSMLRAAPFPRFINTLMALAGLMLLVRTFRSGGWTHYGLGGYIFTWLDGLWFGLTRALRLRLAPVGVGGGGRAAARKALPVVRGLLLAAPVVILFAALLASADLVFAGEIEKLVSVFSLERLPEYIFRLFLIFLITYVMAGLYAQAVRPARWLLRLPGDEPALPEDGSGAPMVEAEGLEKPAAPQEPAAQSPGRFLGSTEGFIVLGSVDALFLAFVAVQFRYFFGGQANITAAGFTYSEYARRGFFELVTVAVFSLVLYMVLNAITKRSTSLLERLFTILSTVLVGSVLVILVSAFQRLLLYEDAYGFTRQRTYTHIFIPWLAALLVGTILLQILRRERYWGALFALIVFGWAASFGVMNIDGLIARQNIARAMAGEELDGMYLLELSDDALPELVRGYQAAKAPAEMRETLGAALACKVYQNGMVGHRPWQSYHPGSAAAWGSLVGLDLSQFPVNDSDASVHAVDVNGSPFYCYGNTYID